MEVERNKEMREEMNKFHMNIIDNRVSCHHMRNALYELYNSNISIVPTRGTHLKIFCHLCDTYISDKAK